MREHSTWVPSVATIPEREPRMSESTSLFARMKENDELELESVSSSSSTTHVDDASNPTDRLLRSDEMESQPSRSIMSERGLYVYLLFVLLANIYVYLDHWGKYTNLSLIYRYVYSDDW